jgi:hypothetical protein
VEKNDQKDSIVRSQSNLIEKNNNKAVVEPFLYDVEDILHCVGKNERTFVRNTRLH